MSSKMSVNDFQSKVLSELAAIRDMIASAKPSSSSDGKAKKERKPRDPNAKPNDWIVFTSRVRAALIAAGKPAGKECQQFASFLKNEHENAYAMPDDEIVAAREGWSAPAPKPKADSSDSKPESESEAKPKPKRTLSDEQKAKMAAGRKAAAERKKAEKEASQVESAEVPAPVPAPAPEPKVQSKSAPPQPVAKAESKPAPALRALPFKGKKYMWDPESNGLWLQNKDGTKGEWAGVLSSDRKSIDSSAPNPEDVDGADEE